MIIIQGTKAKCPPKPSSKKSRRSVKRQAKQIKRRLRVVVELEETDC